MDGEVLDGIIGRLLEVQTGRPGTLICLTEVEIHQICVASRQIFLAQPNLLELEVPIKICGQLVSLYFSLVYWLIAIVVYLWIYKIYLAIPFFSG